ncbi:MAG: DNA mismatch repair endonuclease MutL [Eisenbergiella sp.]
MAEIMVLDDKTIDQIAAGEVVERPASVVKELVENACDAGATAITVEIKDGGTTFIRVTDNGSGIKKNEVKKAFFRHATSKIRGVEDLSRIHSLGFRGEALSSIAAVAMVELITKTRESLTGVRYCIEGERERDFSEIGAPEGTTIIIRDLFFNTPARKKFLKTPATEGGYIASLMEHMALSRPDISFTFQQNRQTRFSTSGSGDLKEVVYRIYGREIAKEIFPFSVEENGLKAEGFLGTPLLVRPNRNFEFFFVNNRYIKSQILSKGLESGYQRYLMQHKFPMAYLHLKIDTEAVDVNVHPSKMEIRFSDNRAVFDFLEKHVREALHEREMIPSVSLSDVREPLPEKTESKEEKEVSERSAVELAKRLIKDRPASSSLGRVREENAFYGAKIPAGQKKHDIDRLSQQKPVPNTLENTAKIQEIQGGSNKKRTEAVNETDEVDSAPASPSHEEKTSLKATASLPPQPFEKVRLHETVSKERQDYEKKEADIAIEKQMDLFEEKLLTKKAVDGYRLVGQVFDTYWIAVYQDKMILIDQHAAHEKVKYERLIRRFQEGRAESQNLMPPVIVTLTGAEAALLTQYQDYFSQLGFEIDSFGGSSYALRAVPCDLYGHCSVEFLQDVLDELANGQRPGTPSAVAERIATMACKAAVKGNNRMSAAEMQELLEQLLTLDNPYHCPHGRPTMVVMTKQELERKFKRIV